VADVTDQSAIKNARDACDAALRKVLGGGKAANGNERNYAEACRLLSKIDPTFTLPKKKYRP
jgi:hypothetical protein